MSEKRTFKYKMVIGSRSDIKAALLIIMVTASLDDCAAAVKNGGKQTQSVSIKPDCFSDPPVDLHFHEAMLDCSKSNGMLAYIDASLSLTSDPIKDLFTRWYSTNRTSQQVWLGVTGFSKDPKPIWEYVLVDLQMIYQTDRSLAIAQVLENYDSSGTRSSYVSSKINSSTVATYSCISNRCFKKLKLCPSPFLMHADGCYYVADATTSVDVTPADQCVTAGGMLAITETNVEETFMATLMNSMGISSAYLGAEKDFGSTSWSYINSNNVGTALTKRLNTDKTGGLRCAALEIHSKEFAWANVDCVSPLHALCTAQDPPCYLPESTDVVGKCASNPKRGSLCQSKCQPGTSQILFPAKKPAGLTPFFKSLSCHTDPCDSKTYSKAVDVCVCGQYVHLWFPKHVVQLRTVLRMWSCSG